MLKFPTSTFLLFAWSTLALGQTQNFAPPAPLRPDAATLAKIKEKTAELAERIKELEKSRPKPAYRFKFDLDDVRIYHKAAVWIVDYDEWYLKDSGKQTLAMLERGLERAAAMKEGKTPWLQQTGKVAFGYRSHIDISVQPYGLILPADYGKGKRKSWRLDVVLHGRDSTLTEIKHLARFDGGAAPPEQDWIELHVYGRGNNAYRWAGERDVHDAIWTVLSRAVIAGEPIDKARIVLRGFSMGGAGSWHLGLHHPSKWCSVSPGAGFSTTRGYVPNLPPMLPDYFEKCLHIYDAVDYAENAFNVPVVAYGGDMDPQLQAARNIETKLKGLNIPMTLLVGKDTGHKYHPDSLKEIMRLQGEHAAKGRPQYPAKIHHVTYTPKYGRCHWLQVEALQELYKRAVVDAVYMKDGSYKLTTQNVLRLEIDFPEDRKPGDVTVQIDGEKLTAKGDSFLAEVGKDGTWKKGYPRAANYSPHKDMLTCGPIDDAFTRGFECVRGTVEPWNAAVQQYADAEFARFQGEWRKWFRGDIRINNKLDPASLKEECRSNLILFGDPGSNPIISAIVKELPITWTKEKIVVGGQEFSTADHVPVLIIPNRIPIHARFPGYIVINSGHTFHEAEFKGTNALLYPRLGDWAVLKLKKDGKSPLDVEVVAAGLFDNEWKVPKK